MGLFAVSELSPDFCCVFLPQLATLLSTRDAFPNLPTVVCAVLLE